MKYLKIILTLALLAANYTVMAEDGWDCSVIKDGHYIERICATTTTEVKNIEIKNLTDGLELALKKTHINQAMTNIGEPILFYSGFETITSIFPPTSLTKQHLLTFNGSGFVVSTNKIKDTGLHNPFPTINIIILLICTLISSFLLDKNTPLLKRSTILGLMISLIYGIITLGNNTDTNSSMKLALLICTIIAFAVLYLTKERSKNEEMRLLFLGLIIYASSLVISVTSTQSYLYNYPNTFFEWLGFCLLLVLVEYTIVFYRQYKERSVLATT